MRGLHQVIFGALLMGAAGIGVVRAQDSTWTKPGALGSPATQPGAPTMMPAPVQTAPAQASPPSGASREPRNTMQDGGAADVQTVPAAGTHPTGYVPVPGKQGKLEYVGPKAVVELAPTPMLDEEGRQRLDPEGKPMFDLPVKQQRDKHGNPLFDEQGKPVFQTTANLGYDDKGKKIHGKKEKAPKTVALDIERGTLTVDGMTGKAGLNYDIKNFKYVYLYAPWIGITIVSDSPFPGAIEQKEAFKDQTLTVTVEDHTLQLYSDKRLLGKKPEPAYVAVDRSFKLPSAFPVIGYGETLKPPYAWPGSKENASLKSAPPVLPPSLRPVTLLQPCAAGMMREPGRTALPGENLPPPACVPITRALPGAGTPRAVADAQPAAEAAGPGQSAASHQ